MAGHVYPDGVAARLTNGRYEREFGGIQKELENISTTLKDNHSEFKVFAADMRKFAEVSTIDRTKLRGDLDNHLDSHKRNKALTGVLVAVITGIISIISKLWK